MIGAEGFETLFGNASAVAKGGGRARGIFHLPVCYTPGGQAISSINLVKGRNLPCTCSKFNFPEQRLLGAGLQPRSQIQTTEKRSVQRGGGGGGGGWTGDNSATYDFLLSSGLYESRSFQRLCKDHRHSRKKRGNHCKVDKSVSWTWPRGGLEEGKVIGDTTMAAGKKKNQLRHPYKRCKSNNHKYVGCETPHNDSYKQNKKCKKAMGLSDMDYSLITAGANGMNATWSNSDYIDYDVDFGIDSDTDEEEHLEAGVTDDTDGEGSDLEEGGTLPT